MKFLESCNEVGGWYTGISGYQDTRRMGDWDIGVSGYWGY